VSCAQPDLVSDLIRGDRWQRVVGRPEAGDAGMLMVGQAISLSHCVWACRRADQPAVYAASRLGTGVSSDAVGTVFSPPPPMSSPRALYQNGGAVRGSVRVRF
jgi:hypothetical protein